MSGKKYLPSNRGSKTDVEWEENLHAGKGGLSNPKTKPPCPSKVKKGITSKAEGENVPEFNLDEDTLAE